MLPTSIRKWVAFGTGVGIEMGSSDLTVSIVRVRPKGTSVVASTAIAKFRMRPAAEWGKEYADFLRQHRASHLAAVVLAPRHEVIVRTLPFPGVSEAELAGAVGYQLDSLHPYGEDDAVGAWARLDAVNVLIGVIRRQTFEQYAALFAEAGVKVASFTFSAAAIRAAIRILADPPKNFLAGEETAAGFAIYGESEGRPVFSAVLEMPEERAFAYAAAELRLPPGTEPVELGIGPSHAAAMCSACPGLVTDANFLPEAERRSSSKLRYVPSAVLAATLAGLCVAILFHEPYDEGVYRQALERELQRVEPISSRVPALDRNLERTMARVRQLDEFRQRTRADLDLILELTNTFQAPAFLSSLEIGRESVVVAGETEQAAPLIRILDNSPRLAASEPTMPYGRVGNSEVFRIRSQRETPPAAASVPAAAAPPAAPAPGGVKP